MSSAAGPARPGLVKRLEYLAKIGFAVVMSVLLWRPGRKGRALPAGPRRVLLVRVDNRVGEALLTTPLIDALAAAGHEVHVLAHPKMRRVLDRHPRLSGLHDYAPRWAVLSALRALRFDAVVNCGNWDLESVTSAVVARLVGPAAVVYGPANFPSGWLMDVPIVALASTRSEAVQRRHLGSALVSVDGPARLSFRETPAFQVVEGRSAVVNPGGRLDWRRVPVERFVDACRALLEAKVTPVVTWGPGEEALADEVVRGAPGAVKAPATSIDQLAALMRGAVVTVCNNTGPMHLAVAVGCPTLALFLHMEVERWGHAFEPHVMLDLTSEAAPGERVARAVRELVALPARA
ncbi:MAG: glycosyltransferase family 9 protein [Myxococcaceae bacterium]